MDSFIAVTSEIWFDYHVSKKHDKVIFWTNRLIKLEKGTKFFFLCGVGTHMRHIAGYAIMSDMKKLNIDNMWNQFRELCGADTLDDLMDEISTSTSKKSLTCDNTINLWILEKFTVFEKKIDYISHRGEGRRVYEIYPGPLSFPSWQQVGSKFPETETTEILSLGLRKLSDH